MRVAAIDCGTNSIRLLVVEGDAQQRTERTRRTTIVRLGQGVDASGQFHPDALARTFAACEDFARIIEPHDVERVRFVATSAARDAHNRQEFFDGVQQRLGVLPEVIPGDEEARLSYTGAAAGIDQPETPILVCDIGGGSTELIRGDANHIEAAQSLDMGAVRLRERFLQGDPPTADQIAAARAYANDLLDACSIPLEGIGTWVGVAGTATTMAAVDLELEVYDRKRVHRHEISVPTIERTAERWLTHTVEQVRTEPAMHPQRAEIICAGGLILSEIARRVARPMIVSESDILDGIAMDMLRG